MTENFLKLMRKSNHRFRKHYEPPAGDIHTTFKGGFFWGGPRLMACGILVL